MNGEVERQNRSILKRVRIKESNRIVESNEGVQHKRNVTHLKKNYERECTCMSEDSLLIEN